MKDSQKIIASKPGAMPMILAAMVSGAVAFLLTQLHFTFLIRPSLTATHPPVPLPVQSSAPLSSPSTQQPTPMAVSNGHKEGLRVSNRTPYPLRVVLRRHRPSASAGSDSPSTYADSVHWDFDPQEGSQSPLPVSVPQENLRLQSGDILMAFALDGSRRYWGPYIVGQTPNPIHPVSTADWQLILQP